MPAIGSTAAPRASDVRRPSYSECRALREGAGAPWFSDQWDLNLLILRSGVVGEWDDLAVVACLDDEGREVVQAVQVTADAWRGEWLQPTNAAGCVYILDGHYPGGYSLGAHRGRPALRQRKPFSYVRWPAGSVPTVGDLEARAVEHAFESICGTHLHNRATARAPDRPRTDDSEGCVVSLYYHEHAALVELVATQATRAGSDIVSPTFLTI